MLFMRQVFKVDFLSSIFFSLILLSAIFTRVADISGGTLVTKYALVAYIAWMFLTIIFKKTFYKSELKLFFPLILFNGIYIVNAKSLTNSDDILMILNHFIFFMVVYVLTNVKWDKKQIRMLSSLFYISFPVLILMSFVLTDELNKNAIGAYAYYLAFFPLLYLIGYSKSLKQLQIFMIFSLSLIVVFASDSRSIIFSVFISLFTFFIWKILSASKALFSIYFLSIVGFIYWFTVIWPKAYTWKYFYVLDNWSYKLTEKTLLTGRERIWERLVEFVKDKLFLGYGSSVVPENLTGTALSAHNSYIQIGIQVGIVGILFLVIFLFFVWRTLWKNRFDPKVKLAGSFLIGIMIYQLFEVSLTQNQFGLGLLQWIIIGFGLSFALNKESTEPR